MDSCMKVLQIFYNDVEHFLVLCKIILVFYTFSLPPCGRARIILKGVCGLDLEKAGLGVGSREYRPPWRLLEGEQPGER